MDSSDRYSVDNIAAYLEQQRGRYTIEVLKQGLLRDGCPPDRVLQAIQKVFGPFANFSDKKRRAIESQIAPHEQIIFQFGRDNNAIICLNNRAIVLCTLGWLGETCSIDYKDIVSIIIKGDPNRDKTISIVIKSHTYNNRHYLD